MSVTHAEVLADYSLKKNPIYSYLSLRVQGTVTIFCDYEGEGIWCDVLNKYTGTPVYSLSLNLLEMLRDWNWLYDLYDLGSGPEWTLSWINEPEIVDEFTQTGKELACQVKKEAPLCRVIFWDEVAWLRSKDDLPAHAFNYEVLLNAEGQPWLCRVPAIEKRPVRFQNIQSRDRSKVFRTALCRGLVLCRNIRTIDIRQLSDDREPVSKRREAAGYVISFGRRKKIHSPPLNEQILHVQRIIQECLIEGEHIEYKYRALWIISDLYTISFSVEAYNKNATLAVHMDDSRLESETCDYGRFAGNPTIEPLCRMSTSHAFKRVRNDFSRNEFLSAIEHTMGLDCMVSLYPNPADMFVASVKRCD